MNDHAGEIPPINFDIRGRAASPEDRVLAHKIAFFIQEIKKAIPFPNAVNIVAAYTNGQAQVDTFVMGEMSLEQIIALLSSRSATHG